jgi:hypothetical protein
LKWLENEKRRMTAEPLRKLVRNSNSTLSSNAEVARWRAVSGITDRNSKGVIRNEFVSNW